LRLFSSVLIFVTPRLVCASSKAELFHLLLFCCKACLREWKKRPGEEERRKRERNALTFICYSIYCQKTLPVLREPEINPGVLSLEGIWETSTYLCFTEVEKRKEGRESEKARRFIWAY